jgi:hypothetical protein
LTAEALSLTLHSFSNGAAKVVCAAFYFYLVTFVFYLELPFAFEPLQPPSTPSTPSTPFNPLQPSSTLFNPLQPSSTLFNKNTLIPKYLNTLTA